MMASFHYFNFTSEKLYFSVNLAWRKALNTHEPRTTLVLEKKAVRDANQSGGEKTLNRCS